MKKRMVKKSSNKIKHILFIISTIILIFILCFSIYKINQYEKLKEKEQLILNNIKKSYYKNIITTKETNLYIKKQEKYKKIGYVINNQILTLDYKKIGNYKDIYFKVKNHDYYVKYKDVKPYKNNLINNNYLYANYGKKIITKKKYNLKQDNSIIYSFNRNDSYEIVENEEKYYGVIYNKKLYQLDKENVLSEEDYIVKNVALKVPILNYHFFYDPSVGEVCNEDICEPTRKFKEQLNYLKDNNFKILTMEEFKKWMYGEIQLPSKSVLITIDDGAMGTSYINGNKLIPILEKYKIPATLFLITAWWNKKDYKSPYLLVQSHGYNIHNSNKCRTARAFCMTQNDLVQDLKKSISLVDSDLSFAYPFFMVNDKIEKSVKEAGFKLAFIGGWKKATRSNDKYRIPRYEIINSISIEQFKSYVN